jgi:type IV secretion system protein VirB5
MNALRKTAVSLVLGLSISGRAFAGIPVIDATSIVQQIQQVIAWGQQYGQMVETIANQVQEYTQLVDTYTSMNGIRNLAGLGSGLDMDLRTYMPDGFDEVLGLAEGVGGTYGSLSSSVTAIKSAAHITDSVTAGFEAGSPLEGIFNGRQNQVALNRGLGEASYKQASDRIRTIQQLMAKVDNASDQKEVLDLQARIQAEQAMLQNETIKLSASQQLAKAQEDIANQQIHELRMAKSANPTRIAGW